MDAVVLEQVTKRFDSVVAVSDLSLRIKQGAIFGLLGPNGAGKTTTLRMMMRVMIPDEGSVDVLGEPLSDRTQDLIGYLPEERGLYPRMQLRKVLVFLAALKGLSEDEADRRARAWLERMELADWAEKKVIDLSKGMQQKAQFIAAVLHRPPLLILDEPFDGLDPLNAAAVKDIMLELRDQGTTIVLSTHRMEQVEMMCDSICLINKGRNILGGDLRAIKQSYGKNTLRMEFTGEGGFLNSPLVEKVNRFGAVVEARLRRGADPQELLKAAVAEGARIARFELLEPPLNDIFIEKVSEDHA
ncbi:MAG: ABC transporter [Acidobacteria bacterium]|nr:MAG: ABC transporter [Acidobacteriota bacterium]